MAMFWGAPETKYVDGVDGFVAYQVVGQGPPDIVFVPSWGHTIEGIWDSPAAERFLRRLASLGRLVTFDLRGSGVSDPLPSPFLVEHDFGYNAEEAAADLQTVLDHLEIERVSLVSTVISGSISLMFAATRPDRVEALILIDPIPRLLAADDYPWGFSAEMAESIAERLRETWGTGEPSAFTVPSLRRNTEFLSWAARHERAACARGVMAGYWKGLSPDFRALLPSVRCPTLVMYHSGNDFYDPGQAIYVASQIPGAGEPVEIATRDLEIFGPQPEAALDEIEVFISAVAVGDREGPASDRAFAVVMFTDLVDSTKTAAAVGDRRWRELLDVHDSVGVRQIAAHRGRLVKRTGDGVLAVFEAPARAVRCAQAMHAELAQVGVAMRAGIHAGEVEMRGDDIGGLAVHIAARVAATAHADEVLVSRTVTDLVAGSGLAFVDRGEHELKGVPSPWQLFATMA